jgi:glucosamine-6-phosphate deaminase
MAPIRVIPASDEDNVHQKVATLLLSAVIEKPDLILSVFAGTPAFGLYKLMTERARGERVDFSRVRFVVFDELIRGGGGTPFRSALDERLFGPLSVPPENVVAYIPANDPQSEGKRIAAWLDLAGIDIALLSVDSRGHIGFHAAGAKLDSRAGPVRTENSQRWNASTAFSLGLADLARAAKVILFAAGGNLAQIVQQLTEGTFDPGIPISVLQRHENLLLVADRGALSQVQRVERIFGFHSGHFIMDSESVPSGRKVLVVSPHPDDAPISLGGTMAMLSAQNRIVTAVMTTGHRSFIYGTQRAERIAIREQEVVAESRVLGVEPRFLRLPFYDNNYEVSEKDLETFCALLKEASPDWLFLPHANDRHPAHQASRRVVLQGLRRCMGASAASLEAWNYEGPWALFNHGEFNTIVSIPGSWFEKKILAIRAHRSQVSRTPYDVAAESLGRLRSSLVPESELAGFGAKPPKLEPFFELFFRESLRGEQQPMQEEAEL